jgi:hypothetical protein
MVVSSMTVLSWHSVITIVPLPAALVLNVSDMAGTVTMAETFRGSPMAATPSYARLIVPRRSLVSCVPAYIVRSTLGSAGPGFNHYPATPFCSVYWGLQGSTAVVEDGVVSHDLVAQAGDAIFSGPQPQPWTTFNPGPTQFFVAMFSPDALHALCGIDQSACVGRFLPAGELLGDAWQALGAALSAARDDDARVSLLDDFLEARWRAVHDQAGPARAPLGDWVRRLALQAATSGIGRGVRMAERRIKARAGLPMRMLQRMGRAYQVLQAARSEQARGRISWGGVEFYAE